MLSFSKKKRKNIGCFVCAQGGKQKGGEEKKRVKLRSLWLIEYSKKQMSFRLFQSVLFARSAASNPFRIDNKLFSQKK